MKKYIAFSLFAFLFLSVSNTYALVDTFDRTRNNLFFDGAVWDFATDDSTLYVAGGFSGVYGLVGSAILIDGETGVADFDFPRIVGAVNDVIPDGSGGWYMAGDTLAFEGEPVNAAVLHMNADQTLDESFDVGMDIDSSNILSIALSPDGNTIYAAGSFTEVNTDVPRNYIAAFNTSDGSVTNFDPNLDAQVNQILLSADGTTLYAGGTFTTVNGGTTRNKIAAFDTTTGTATAFNPNANGFGVGEIVLSSDETILYAYGDFTTVNGGTSRNKIAAFTTADGVVTGFAPDGTGAFINTLALSSDDSILYVGGFFNSIAGSTRYGLASFTTADGVITAFDPEIDDGGRIDSIVLSADDSTVFTLGAFLTAHDALDYTHIAEFGTADGALTDFNPVIKTDANAKVIFRNGGDLLVGISGSGGIGANLLSDADNLVAIDLLDFSLVDFDAGFDASLGTLSAIDLSPDGQTLYVGGYFPDANDGTLRNSLAAVDTTSGILTAFNPNIEDLANVDIGSVNEIEVSSDGTTVFALGSFDTVNGGTGRSGVASFSATDGTVTAFDPDITIGGDGLLALDISPDDSTVYVGGDFTEVNGGGVLRDYIAAFDSSSGVATAFTTDASEKVQDIEISSDGTILYYAGGFSGTQAVDAVTGTTVGPDFVDTYSALLGLSRNDETLYVAPISGFKALDTTTGDFLDLVAGDTNANQVTAFLVLDDHSELFLGSGTLVYSGENTIWPIGKMAVFSGDPEEIPVDEEETPPAEEEEDNGGSGGSHRRSGGGSSSNGDAALLESLLARVQELKAILASLLGTPSTTSGDYARDLDINSEGSDVTALQLFLIAQNKGPQAQALAAVGATGFFGPLTQAALAEYQTSVGITPAVGFFGPVTRAYINGL